MIRQFQTPLFAAVVASALLLSCLPQNARTGSDAPTMNVPGKSETALAHMLLRAVQDSVQESSIQVNDCPANSYSPTLRLNRRDIFLQLTGKEIVAFKFTDGGSAVAMHLVDPDSGVAFILDVFLKDGSCRDYELAELE